MKEYILNIEFETWTNQLWFMGRDDTETKEKWQNAITNIEELKKSSQDANSFQNNVIEYFKGIGFLRIQK